MRHVLEEREAPDKAPFLPRALRAAILHRHALFSDLIEHELHDLGPTEICGSTSDPDVALDLVREHRLDALIVESGDRFFGREQLAALFCRAVADLPGFLLVSADLETSVVEVLEHRVGRASHLDGLRPVLIGDGR